MLFRSVRPHSFIHPQSPSHGCWLLPPLVSGFSQKARTFGDMDRLRGCSAARAKELLLLFIFLHVAATQAGKVSPEFQHCSSFLFSPLKHEFTVFTDFRHLFCTCYGQRDEAEVGFLFASFLFEFACSTLNGAAVTFWSLRRQNVTPVLCCITHHRAPNCLQKQHQHKSCVLGAS